MDSSNYETARQKDAARIKALTNDRDDADRAYKLAKAGNVELASENKRLHELFTEANRRADCAEHECGVQAAESSNLREEVARLRGLINSMYEAAKTGDVATIAALFVEALKITHDMIPATSDHAPSEND